ncbi:MAG: murein biosynthesis integral membrane protein MurJ [Bdellovibrionales bacterium]|nr:murein biosynthesis integral membrane protein MurJ [Bdellovibrionales bacterium]
MNQAKHQKSLIKSALAMALGTFSSRIAGLVRDVVVSSQFLVTVTDSWFVAFRIPNMLRRIFGEGAFSASFIPEFVDKIENAGEDEAKRFSWSIFTILFITLMTLSILGILFSAQIIHPLVDGKGFTEIPGKIEATIRYSKIMFFFLFFVCIYAFFMAQLNTFKQFFWPAFTPIFLNLSLITFALMPKTWVSYPGDLLSYAVLVGGFLQMAFLLPPLYKAGYFPKLYFSFKGQAVKNVFKNMIPGIITIGILQFTNIINVKFAAGLENGSNSWIYYADRLLELPLSLISVSLGTALLPSLAEAVSKMHWTQFRHQFVQSIKFSLYLSIPSAATLFFLSQEIISTLFLRGKFSAYDMTQTSYVLEVYALALVAYTLLKIVNAAFYSLRYYWLPTLISLLILCLHIGLVSITIDQFGLKGIAASTAISSAIGMCILLVVFYVKFPATPVKDIFISLVKISVSTLMMVLSFSVYPILGNVLLGSEVGRVVCLVITLVIAASMYIFSSKLLGLHEADELLKILKRRVSKKT